MASVIIDERQNYVWQVSDGALGTVLDYVLHRLNAASAFHELLYTAKTYGRLEFFRLGERQREQFETLVKAFYDEHSGGADTDDLKADEMKEVKRLLGLIAFSKTLDE